MNQSDGPGSVGQSADLRTRIAAVIADDLYRQGKQEYASQYRPMDDDGNDLPELIGLDASIDPAVVADAVIRELQMTCEVADSSQFHCTKRSARRYVTAWFAEWVADE